MAGKSVYFFGGGRAEGHGGMKELLGGKGAGLMEMTRIGLPVPAGFVITTATCARYMKEGRAALRAIDREVRTHLARLEKVTGKRFADPDDPLLVSVRSGAARSMPGMMETILNLGLNDRTVSGLAKKTGNERFAWDAYRRFVGMYAGVVHEVPREEIEARFRKVKEQFKVRQDTEVPAEGLRDLCGRLKELFRERTGKDFPQDPTAQLWGAIEAVFRSWSAEKALTYRRVERITGLAGTAVNVVQMVFGNKGETSGTGVCFTRDPNSGAPTFYGDVLMNAQGEDVVAGIRTPLTLDRLQEIQPAVYRQLLEVRRRLERHTRDMQDIEFTIEEGTLYILQCRAGKRSPRAAFRIAADLVREKVITREEALQRIAPEDVERLFYPVVDPRVPAAELQERKLVTGIGAVPGAASGALAFTAAEAEERARAGEAVILVRHETSPEDVGGMHAAQGILTATGGKTSHAAVVARGWGKTCIVGCDGIEPDPGSRTLTVAGKVLKATDRVTLDGTTGTVYAGDIALVQPDLPDAYHTIMKWADAARRLRVRANVDTPYDAAKAVQMGAEGIGLCRTEHMFFDTEERRLAIQEMILASDRPARQRALAKLLPVQRRDFEGIFTAMAGRPVTIRLLDPPLHEFVPHDEEGQARLGRALGIPADAVARRVDQLREANPMLGHRGCRLALTYPEILEMQVRAIVEAAIAARKKGTKVLPEIMHPLTIDPREMAILVERTRAVADEVIRKAGTRLPYLVGTMIEVPRAALLAGRFAETAEFFSFGTNDLTQMTLALSRDDAGRFLPQYVGEENLGIFRDDPFQTLDQDGVGELVRVAIERGRAARPGMKIGVCGEHGGEARSVKFCDAVGMDYVSCSPYRLPIARLAAAQATLASGRGKKTAAKSVRRAAPGKRGSAAAKRKVRRAVRRAAAREADAPRRSVASA
ncbi:MAG TPA: pyruvate, phosphate dikinase [Candidatus Polarisedimenticolia bacterium]|nr:pyruvate, phosphate dikinase [Candidatus Polarisedimenticolia bacterium]